MTIRLKSAGKTDVGLKRTENEDNFIMLPDQGLYVLADGMGGHASGKMASTLAVTHITEFVCVTAKQPNFSFMYKPDESMPYEANVLVNAVKYANERVFIQSCKERSMEGMGTTVTAILHARDFFVIAHVGDSRIYRVRQNELKQMTVDHSLLNHLLSTGELRPEDADTFQNKNVILRAIGLKDYVDVEAQVIEKVPGDLYMMCSDGLSDLVPDHVIERVLNASPSLPDACNTLIQLALNAGGKDNITVVCVQVEDVAVSDERARNYGVFIPVNAPEPEPEPEPELTPPPARRGMPAAPPPRGGAVAPPPPRKDRERGVENERLHAVRVPREARFERARSNPSLSQAAPSARPAAPERRRQQRDWAPPAHQSPRQGTPPAPVDSVQESWGNDHQAVESFSNPERPRSGHWARQPSSTSNSRIPVPEQQPDWQGYPSGQRQPPPQNHLTEFESPKPGYYPPPDDSQPIYPEERRETEQIEAVDFRAHHANVDDDDDEDSKTILEMPVFNAAEYAKSQQAADDEDEDSETIIEMPAFKSPIQAAREEKMREMAERRRREEAQQPSIIVDEEALKPDQTIILDDDLLQEMSDAVDEEPVRRPPPPPKGGGNPKIPPPPSAILKRNKR